MQNVRCRIAGMSKCPFWFDRGAPARRYVAWLLLVAVLGSLVRADLIWPQSASAAAPRCQPQVERKLTPDQAAKLKPGDEFQECSICPRMVAVPTGTFMMGSSNGNRDERPVHKVTIRHAFAAGKFEITVAEYGACVRDGACDEPQWRQRGSYYNIKTGSNDHYKRLRSALTDPRYPVVGVSWINTKQFVDWVNRKVGGTSYRLLTEAEWEYLARAGQGQRDYWWGDRFEPDYANSAIKSARDQWAFTAPVGSFPMNSHGLHDLHGNVWEWVEDCYAPSYVGAPRNGAAKQVDECNRHVVRGGSWYYVPRLLRSADRYGLSLVKRRNDVGFRVGRTLSTQN